MRGRGKIPNPGASRPRELIHLSPKVLSFLKSHSLRAALATGELGPSAMAAQDVRFIGAVPILRDMTRR